MPFPNFVSQDLDFEQVSLYTVSGLKGRMKLIRNWCIVINGEKCYLYIFVNM